jgi:hypothetical protein
MHQKIAAILTWFTIGLLGTPAAHARSISLLVKPNQPELGGLQFNVKRTIDKNPQQYHFTVDIISKDWKILDGFTASLAWGGPSGRSITCKRQDDRHLTCPFTVPIKAVQNPRLVFFYSGQGFSVVQGKQIPAPYVDMRYFPLKNAVSQ